MKKKIFMFLIVFSFIFSFSFGQIDSQWRGPERDGIYPDKGLLKEWPADGPKLLWSVDGLCEGYSSPAVTSDRVYVTGMVKGTGYLFAYDKKGKRLWKVEYGPEWDGDRPGARTTPTVVGDRIYLLSSKGSAVCLDSSGKKIWSVDLIKDFNARNLQWGITESPLVDGDRVFFTPGGPDIMMVALDRSSGKVIWKIKGNNDTSGYCSPCLVKHGGRRLLLTMTGEAFVGVDADTGKYLWSRKHVTSYKMNANTPLYFEGQVFANSGYGTGGQMFKLSVDGNSVDLVWTQKKMDSQMGSQILVDGYVYGSGHNKRGWHCLDWKTGEVQYAVRQIGNKGNIIFADGMLYCYSERGDVALVKPDPQKFDVVSSFKIQQGSGQHWAHPVIKDGNLYVRHGDALMVYGISK